MVDLHAHSTASDGTLTPSELITRAASAGLRAVALTDHDTVAGLDEASAHAAHSGIHFIPGIELEVEWDPGVFHLLGLGLRDWAGSSRGELELARTFRRERNLEMVDLLQAAGYPITYEALVRISGHDTVGRPHFARWFLDHGVVSSMQEAFDTLIGAGQPFYRPKRGLSAGRTCDIVHNAGGLAVLAHPQSLQMSWDDLDKSLKRWRGEGLDGVEAYHPGLSCRDGRRIESMAEDLGLIVTAGSDYHGPLTSERELGYACDETPIADRFLDSFVRTPSGADANELR